MAVWLLGASLLLALAGCQGSRACQDLVQDLQQESLAIEMEYDRLANRYRKQQDELSRLRQKLGLPDPAPDDFDSSLPGSYYSDDESQLAGMNRPHRSRAQRSTSNPLNPSISMPSESLSPEEFMAILEGGDLNATPQKGQRIADAAAGGNDASLSPGDLEFGDPSQLDDAVAQDESGPPFVDPLAVIPADETSNSLSRIGSSRGSSPDGQNSLAVNPIGVSRQNRLDVGNDGRIETMRNPSNPSRQDRSAVVDHVTTNLVIDPLLTRGKDFDGADGDDGIVVVFETRNAADQFVAQPGLVTISLIDPQEEGEAQRVGLWEFSREEIASRLNEGPNQGRGVTLNLTWPHSQPQHRELSLFIRFENAQGELLETAGDVSIAIPGDGRTGWSVRLNDQAGAIKLPRSSETNVSVPTMPDSQHPSASDSPARLGPPSTTGPSFPRVSQPSTDSTRPQWRPYR